MDRDIRAMYWLWYWRLHTSISFHTPPCVVELYMLYIGYINFDNLIILPCWCLQNLTPRYVYNKFFFVFHSFREHLQIFKKCKYETKNLFKLKIKMRIKNRRILNWFQILWKSYNKIHRKQKVIKKLSFWFLLCKSLFFSLFFLLYFTDSNSVYNSAFFKAKLNVYRYTHKNVSSY